MALVSELSMYKATTLKLQHERESREEELTQAVSCSACSIMSHEQALIKIIFCRFMLYAGESPPLPMPSRNGSDVSAIASGNWRKPKRKQEKQLILKLGMLRCMHWYSNRYPSWSSLLLSGCFHHNLHVPPPSHGPMHTSLMRLESLNPTASWRRSNLPFLEPQCVISATLFPKKLKFNRTPCMCNTDPSVH